MKKHGKLQRLSAEDCIVAEEVFKAAMYMLQPDEQSQKEVFKKLLPYIYTLRDGGATWNQLIDLLSQCGFNLSHSSIRVYYSEMVAMHEPELKKQLKTHKILLQEVRKFPLVR